MQHLFPPFAAVHVCNLPNFSAAEAIYKLKLGIRKETLAQKLKLSAWKVVQVIADAPNLFPPDLIFP
jgi:hypothetical protein